MESSIKKAPEIGSLWADSQGGSRFVGSASGVYFLRTVQNAFSQATTKLRNTRQNSQHLEDITSQSQLSPECFFGNEEEPVAADVENLNQTPRDASSASQNSWSFLNGARRFPAREQAKALTKIYFQRWHPLIPFLHGPTFLNDMEEALATVGEVQKSRSSSLGRDIILHCIWNIAILDAPELRPLDGLHKCSPEELLPALSVLALKGNLASIQALLSAQLYFVATMSLRSALVTGGLAIRAIMQSGLHRCPFRYPEISTLDCDMRKRVFWSAYVLDRFLSQALGQPLGIQDSDVDVCAPGLRDLHDTALSTTNVASENFPMDATVHLPRTHPDHPLSSPTNLVHVEADQASEHNINAAVRTPDRHSMLDVGTQNRASTKSQGQSALSDLVTSSRLLGRALQTFHISIHIRSVSLQDIWSLRADIESWANNSIFHESESEVASGPTANISNAITMDSAFSTFSIVSYHQLLLITNRPSLSLKPDSVEFRLALQVCISAAKSILQTLRTFVKGGNRIFWPGHLLAVWMSGLVIAFACRLKAYDIGKAVMGLEHAINLLQTMRFRWPRAKACLAVLQELLQNVKTGKEGLEKHVEETTADAVSDPTSKRRKRNPTSDDPDLSSKNRSIRSNRRSREPPVNHTLTQSRPVNSETGVNIHDSQQLWHTGSDRDLAPAGQIAEASIFTRGDSNGNGFGYSENEHFQATSTWPQSQQNMPIGWNTGGDIYLNASNHITNDFWPPNAELDFTVWDSLQQLVTNVDMRT